MKKHVFVVFTNEVVWDCLAIARMQTFKCGGSYAAVQLLTCGWRTDIDARSSGRPLFTTSQWLDLTSERTAGYMWSRES